MASLRKKYQVQFGSPGKDDDVSPVLPPPVMGAELPPAVEPKPIEPVVETSPADEAGKNRLRDELRKMERAEALQRERQQSPQLAEEPQESQQPQDPLALLPPRVQRWYREHPELATDPERAAQVQYCHHVARRETGGEFTDPYFDRMEAMLFRPATNGHAESRPSPAPSAPRHVEPPRQPAARMSAPVSAPPTREVPSMSTGRSPGYRAPLSKDELEIAAACGQTPEQYHQQKEKMLRMKTAGEIQT